MEEILVMLVQLIFEVMFNAAVSLPFDWFLDWRDVEGDGASAGMGVAPVTATTADSLVFFRVINLIFAPIMAGGLSAYFASCRKRQTTRRQLQGHFLNSFLFTLAFAAVRWVYSQ